MKTQDKVRENACRRHARRLGLMLHKSRVRHWHIDDLGGYMITDPNLSNVVIRGERFQLTLDDVEHVLNDYERRLRESQKQVV